MIGQQLLLAALEVGQQSGMALTRGGLLLAKFLLSEYEGLFTLGQLRGGRVQLSAILGEQFAGGGQFGDIGLVLREQLAGALDIGGLLSGEGVLRGSQIGFARGKRGAVELQLGSRCFQRRGFVGQQLSPLRLSGRLVVELLRAKIELRRLIAESLVGGQLLVAKLSLRELQSLFALGDFFSQELDGVPLLLDVQLRGG
jgi:hypothetical protein